MSEPYRVRRASNRRLSVIIVLVAAMILTLFARLYWVQLLDPHPPVQTAGLLHDGDIVIPAPRGDIVDARGQALVRNTSTQVLTVDRMNLLAQADRGAGVLNRLAWLLGTTSAQLSKQITPCSPTVSAPCWTGEPYQPVPVLQNVPTSVALSISEHREQYPGVALQTVTQPLYPGGSLAAHVLGYTGAVNATDEKANSSLVDADTIGRTGLEAQYDSVLRGVDGKQTVLLDPRGIASGTGATVQPVQGDTLVTSINLDVQTLAEQSLAQQIRDSRAKGKPATGGAVIVMDPNSGRIIAAASYPTYDPQLFVGGISDSDYAALTAPSADDPLLSRAIDGAYAPGSTFKLITSSSLVTHGELSLDTLYGCPPSVTIDGRVKTNFDSESFGAIDLRTALGYSCDTFFYMPAANEYYADQARVDAGQKPNEYLQRMAASYGVGRAPSIDLPAGEQSTGSYADRETRLTRWQANKAQYCADAKRGFAGQPNASYLEALAAENCTDGWRYRAGDNADMAIGQGETTVSPLQLALAYSAMFDGGKIWEPTLGWGVVNGAGKLVQTINPKVHNKVAVSQSLFNYIADSLAFSRGWAVSGAFAYIGSPYQNQLGGKTGTAEVYGRGDTSWLASWGPVTHDTKGNVHAGYVVVGMVEQAGTGATAAGPMLKRIWDGMFGVGSKALLPELKASRHLPRIGPQVRITTSSVPKKPAAAGGVGGGSADAVLTPAARAGAQR
ncbi:MAG TPA: penicillin-binding transpeptidase domain-containing protein [Jatrophihabitantaceae bacterium]|nr:penicillin-binding transpeptidase domain-containing protein [Jatrophihabitantaceae bacterium]